MPSKLYTAFFFFLMLGPVLSAQSNWSAGLSLNSGLSGRQLSEFHQYQSTANGDYFSYGDTYRKGLTIGGGAWVQYNFFSFFGLRSGLSYQFAGSRETYLNEQYTADVDQMATLSYDDQTLRVHQLRLPLQLEFSFGWGEWRPFVRGGVVWQADLGYRVQEKFLDLKTEQMVNQESRLQSSTHLAGLSYTAAIGIEINDRINLSLQKTWAPPSHIYWETDPGGENPTFQRTDTGIMVCGFGPGINNYYSTRSYHREQLTLELAYRLW